MAKLFEVGKKYTVYRISEWMACTTKQEFQVVSYAKPVFLPTDLDPVYKLRGKRKQFVLRLKSKAYTSAPVKDFKGGVFEGWDQPVKPDTDGNSWRGNACYNFVGTKEEVKFWVESRQLNPLFDKSRVLAVGEVARADSDFEDVVYPELYKGGCAPIERLLEGAKK